MSSQQQEINEYIKDGRNDYRFHEALIFQNYQYYPEYYQIVRKLYGIFACGDERYMYPRDYTICRKIENYIDSFVEDFQEIQPSLSRSKEKCSILSKYNEIYQMNILSKILSLYYSDFKDDELYKISQVLGNQNNNLDM